MNPRRWLHEHSLKLLAIRDTPNAIAGGVAIGIYFSFAPLFGIKTLSAIVLAWLTRSNIIAAVLAVTLHDVILPFMPVIYRWEYDIGYWLLSQPHHWPPPLHRVHWEGLSWHRLTSVFSGVGKPLLVGGCLCSAPVAALSFVLTRIFVARHQRKKQAREALAAALEENPS
jgi:uncharacterized protein (DUF2062 family)